MFQIIILQWPIPFLIAYHRKTDGENVLAVLHIIYCNVQKSEKCQYMTNICPTENINREQEKPSTPQSRDAQPSFITA